MWSPPAARRPCATCAGSPSPMRAGRDDHVVIDPALFRPAEVDVLFGDAAKARSPRLGAGISWRRLIRRWSTPISRASAPTPSGRPAAGRLADGGRPIHMARSPRRKARREDLPALHRRAVRRSGRGLWFELIDPYRGEPWARIPRAGRADVDRAAAAAKRAMWDGPWATMTASARGKVLRRIGLPRGARRQGARRGRGPRQRQAVRRDVRPDPPAAILN